MKTREGKRGKADLDGIEEPKEFAAQGGANLGPGARVEEDEEGLDACSPTLRPEWLHVLYHMPLRANAGAISVE